MKDNHQSKLFLGVSLTHTDEEDSLFKVEKREVGSCFGMLEIPFKALEQWVRGRIWAQVNERTLAGWD